MRAIVLSRDLYPVTLYPIYIPSSYFNFWANKGYLKESQIETNEETAEKFINGQNHGELLLLLTGLGVCREEELVVHRGCKLNNYHAHTIVALRLKRDGKTANINLPCKYTFKYLF